MSNPKNNESISEKITRLEELTRWFEGDTFTLEEATDKFKQAEKLAGEIEADLADFKNKITVLKQDFSKDS